MTHKAYFWGFKFQKTSGGRGVMPPEPPRRGVACDHTCGLKPKCYGQIETLNPPLMKIKCTCL
jgi:hypothetical protein